MVFQSCFIQPFLKSIQVKYLLMFLGFSLLANFSFGLFNFFSLSSRAPHVFQTQIPFNKNITSIFSLQFVDFCYSKFLFKVFLFHLQIFKIARIYSCYVVKGKDLTSFLPTQKESSQTFHCICILSHRRVCRHCSHRPRSLRARVYFWPPYLFPLNGNKRPWLRCHTF